MFLKGNDTIGMVADDGIHCYPVKKSGYLKPWWDFERHVFAWLIAGVCAVASIILSFHLIIKHYQYYHRPEFQCHIVWIMLMMPIYSVCSFLSMIYYDSAVYFDVRAIFEKKRLDIILYIDWVGDQKLLQGICDPFLFCPNSNVLGTEWGGAIGIPGRQGY